MLTLAVGALVLAARPSLQTSPASPEVPRPAERVILVPLDSRPAAGQFAQMIGAMASVETKLPPYDSLGRFTRPGSPERILAWLGAQDLSGVTALVVSADMIAYGGLIASRENDVSAKLATDRLRRLVRLKRLKAPNAKLYIFASTMRLIPTATKAAAPYRLVLAKYEETKDRYERTLDAALLPDLARLKPKVPPAQIARYEATRQRNVGVEKALIHLSAGPEVDYVIMGQDDAKPDGPHIGENARLRTTATNLGLAKKIFFCEGIDQHANVLMSRALLATRGWSPRVRVVYSDPAGKDLFALYESKTIEASLADQLEASGATLAGPGEPYDYSLYLNTPGRSEEAFRAWVRSLKDEVDQGFPVAVADINFGADGASDRAVYDAVVENGRAMRLLSYAGWNTAGNTMGTAIPAANVYLFARKYGTEPLERETAQREFPPSPPGGRLRLPPLHPPRREPDARPAGRLARRGLRRALPRDRPLRARRPPVAHPGGLRFAVQGPQVFRRDRELRLSRARAGAGVPALAPGV